MIVYCHIPKCAGASFIKILEQLFPTLVQNFNTFDEVGPEIKCIAGHFQSDKYDKIYPDAQKITWLRDPIDRLISNYTFDKNGNWETENEFLLSLRNGDISFMEYANVYRNGMRNYVVDPINAFDFVGVVEHWDECLEKFIDQFGEEKEVEPPTENIQPYSRAKGVRDTLSEDEIKWIKKANQKDYYLYNKALKKWGF